MGGIGSGRHWHYGAKDTVEGYRSIDVRRWQREGLLTPRRCFNWQWTRDGEAVANINVRAEAGRVVLSYRYKRNEGEWESLDYPVLLESTPSTYGGVRYWFRCPAVGCGRKAAVLYLGGRYFACRHCYQLAYSSQRESRDDRAARRADRIRARLGWEPGILNGNELKPKGMHWRTFNRLEAEHDAFVEQSLAGMMARFGISAKSKSIP